MAAAWSIQSLSGTDGRDVISMTRVQIAGRVRLHRETVRVAVHGIQFGAPSRLFVVCHGVRATTRSAVSCTLAGRRRALRRASDYAASSRRNRVRSLARSTQLRTGWRVAGSVRSATPESQQLARRLTGPRRGKRQPNSPSVCAAWEGPLWQRARTELDAMLNAGDVEVWPPVRGQIDSFRDE
jgi:hypothetical protein